jgi:hypothetical protein
MRDMNIMSGASQAVAVDTEDSTAAEKLLQMEASGELALTTWSCVDEGGSVRNDIQYIADNGNAHYYENGNCSSPDTQVSLADGLMQFILAAAEKLRDNSMVLTISSLVASHGAPDGGNHPRGAAVDLVCPSGQGSDCQTLLDQVGAQFGFSAQVGNENYLLDPNSTHAHFSNTGT